MHQVRNLKFLVIFSILFLINDTSGLKCWRCSSDASNTKFCGDSLDLSQLTDQQRKWNYVECGAPPKELENIENLKPVCRIVLQLVNDVQTYERSCYWELENVPSNSCATQKYNPSFVKTIACNTCKTDGCNDKLASFSSSVSKEEVVYEINSAIIAALSKSVFIILVLSVIIGF